MKGFAEINKHNQIRSATVNVKLPIRHCKRRDKAIDLSTLFTYLYLQYNRIQFSFYSLRDYRRLNL